MSTRPYIVTDSTTGAQRLVEAGNQSQARHHVTKDRFKVEAASAKDALRLVGQGVTLEVAGAMPAADAQQEPGGEA